MCAQGVLLYGPPGTGAPPTHAASSRKMCSVTCLERKYPLFSNVIFSDLPTPGKTLIAKAIATNIDAKFLKVVASAIVDKYIGESARLISEMFGKQVPPAAKRACAPKHRSWRPCATAC